MNNGLNPDIIIKDDPYWKEKLADYCYSKEVIDIPKEYYPQKITHKMVINNNNIFNPITQKYNDNELDKSIKNEEKKYMINKISLDYDNQLRNEQTYNIINLNDKLSALNYHENVPEGPHKLNKEVSKAPYNIISNINLDKHHYNKPELRPKIIEEEGNTNNKLIPANKYRDYNIINNRYFAFDKEKTETEKEIEKLTAAKNFLEKQKYDVIRGRFYKKEQEEEFERQLKNKQDNWLKMHSKSGNQIAINPINNKVYNEEEQNRLDEKESNKKNRYKLKDNIEDYYRSLDYNKELNQKNYIYKRISYAKFKTSDERGYDIINLRNNYSQYKDNTDRKIRQLKTDWELIKDGCGENETFSKKDIFKEPYDKSDIDLNHHNYMKERKKKLNLLPTINEDDNLNLKNRKSYRSKILQNNKIIIPNNSTDNINERTIKNNNLIKVGNSCVIDNNPFKYDKQTWFQGTKGRYFPDNNNSKYLKIYDNKQILELRGANPLLYSNQF